MKENFYSEWLKLSNEDRIAIFQETANRKGLPAAVIEKDWWVTLTLRIIFNIRNYWMKGSRWKNFSFLFFHRSASISFHLTQLTILSWEVDTNIGTGVILW